jgi:hypothetical protein
MDIEQSMANEKLFKWRNLHASANVFGLHSGRSDKRKI